MNISTDHGYQVRVVEDSDYYYQQMRLILMAPKEPGDILQWTGSYFQWVPPGKAIAAYLELTK